MRLPLHVRMLLGVVLGAAAGVVAFLLLGDDPRLAAFIRYVTQPVGQIFLRLLFMLVIPLIVSALALGVAGLGDLRSLGRIGLKTLAYTVVVSAIAVLLGVVLVNAAAARRGHVATSCGRGSPRGPASAPRPSPAPPSRRSLGPRLPGPDRAVELRSRRPPTATCWR